MKKFGLIVGTVGTLVSFLTKIYLSFNKEDFIIVNGIRSYKTFSNISTILSIIFLIILISFSILQALDYFKNQKLQRKIEEENIRKEKEKLENIKLNSSYLSSSKELIEKTIREHLETAYMGKWNILEEELKNLYIQSTKMDDLQEKLKSLITKNDASVLNDTEEILEKAEQDLLKNIRKVMNYMDVCDPDTFEEKEKVKISAQNCYFQNKEILNTTSDFLMALTEFLNSQGDENSLSILNEYKDALKNTDTSNTSEIVQTQLKF